MVVVGLLVVAAGLLVAGLAASTPALLVASLIGSLLAAAVLYRTRTPSPPHRPRPVAGSAPVWVVDGRPGYHRRDCELLGTSGTESIPHEQAVQDGFMPCSLCEPDAAPAPYRSAAAGTGDGA